MMIQEAIQDRHIPGAVLSVVHNGIEVCHRAYGNQVVFPKEEQMETNTRFDIASLTKVTAMLPVTLLLVDEGRLQLDTCVRDVFPTFPHERVTVRHLLNHTSGWAPITL
ncbi:serine hydrolase [Geomicrobium sp. JCM 19039]|uniref:serine hydrolase domain-containing protein n=1 Tax=Geomicrobium sp. JCM 19039 TaxID=1460636 RepID=UPI00045F2E4F|nr:serine hydrolase domain-containing protein [Geomicrobium sp. JCM 19039]GAK12641.1 beta-lactamase class C [Geomicrobium sp. JCM 19039]